MHRSRNAFWFRLLMAIGLLVVATFAEADKPTQQEVAKIEIVPGPTFALSSELIVPPAPEPIIVAQNEGQPAAKESDLPVIQPLLGVKTYWEVYSSIPFLRSEYQANPTYRHDATMELLFGKMRPMTIVRYPMSRQPSNGGNLTYPYRRTRISNYRNSPPRFFQPNYPIYRMNRSYRQYWGF